MDKVRQTFTADEQGMADLVDMLKRDLNLGDDDEIAVVRDRGFITISKTGRRCFLCGSEKNLSTIGNNKCACKTCLQAISEAI